MILTDESTIRYGYIPTDMHKKTDQYPKMQPMYFDMPTLAEVHERY